jgi:hypothetical protein
MVPVNAYHFYYGHNSKLAVDVTGNVFIAGHYMGSGDFDPGTGELLWSANGKYNSFVVKMNTTGDRMWDRTLGSNYYNNYNYNIPYGLSVDYLGDAYLAGLFAGTIDFDPSADIYPVDAVENQDAYLLKLDHDGDFAWVRTYGSVNNDAVNSVAFDRVGDLYFSLGLGGSVDLDPDPDSVELGGPGSAIGKLTSEGDLQWITGFTWANSARIAVDGSGDVYLTSWFEGTIDFDPGPDVFELTSAGS